MSTILGCSVRDVYPLLGNIGEDQLPLEVVLPIYHSVVTKRLNDMSISQNNWFTKSVERTVTSNDVPLNSITDFGTPVQVQALVGGTAYNWKPMRFVTLEALDDFAETGQMVVAFYGQGSTLRLRFARGFSLPIKIKIWYEPNVVLADGYQSTNPIPDNFLPLVNYEVAALCAPHVVGVSAEQAASLTALVPMYLNQVSHFLEQWRVKTNPSTVEHRAYSKRRFDRRRFGGN